jgi:uncharacterized protein (DUF1697 family)
MRVIKRPSMTVFIALLRAIGPETHARMSMRDLREACAAAGLPRVTTVLATGNLICDTRKRAASVQAILDRVLRGFGLDNPVFLRRPDELAAILGADPFPVASQNRPSELAVCFLAGAPGAETRTRFEQFLAQYPGPERVAFVGREIVVDYPAGIARSKLMPGVIERRLGMPATARNWNTVRRLATMSGSAG